MGVAEHAAVRPADSRSSRGQAFGIEFRSSFPLPLISTTWYRGDRTTLLEACSPGDVERTWGARRGAGGRVLERRRPDGTLVMSVDHDPAVGYHVYAPDNGRHTVSCNGSRIECALPQIAPWRWQRLLFAQVLPLAATLQGLELLHASAIEWGGRCLGFVAPSGTGKTSVAAHIVASGGALVTDDVLALEQLDGSVAVHPGVSALAIDPDELRSMTMPGRIRVGRPLGRTDKVVLGTPVVDRAHLLERLYFLERRESGGLRIEHLDVEPVRLLANSFNTYVKTPERIMNQLAIAARLVDVVDMFRVRIPPGSPASTVASSVIEHLERT